MAGRSHAARLDSRHRRRSSHSPHRSRTRQLCHILNSQPHQNMQMRFVDSFTDALFGAVVLLWFAAPEAKSADAKATHSTTERGIAKQDADPEKPAAVKIVREVVADAKPAKDRTWLGVGVDEA